MKKSIVAILFGASLLGFVGCNPGHKASSESADTTMMESTTPPAGQEMTPADSTNAMPDSTSTGSDM